jgi:hypothetical protein
VTALPFSITLIAEFILALPTCHMVTPLILLIPIFAVITLLIVTAYQQIEDRLIFDLIFELFTRLARMRLIFAVQAVAFGAALTAEIDHFSLLELYHIFTVRGWTVHHVRVNFQEISVLLFVKLLDLILVSQRLFYVDLVHFNLTLWAAYWKSLFNYTFYDVCNFKNSYCMHKHCHLHLRSLIREVTSNIT